MALGNNKFAAASGTTIACWRYIRKDQVDWKVGTIAILFSLGGSAVGSALATRFADIYLHYLLIFLVPVIAIFIMLKPDFGQAKPMETKSAIPLSALAGLVLGAYDGFFGPGTGMFLTIIFTSIIGLDLLRSVGTAKVVNLASNVAALATFIRFGNIDYAIAIPCAISAIIGGYIGSGLAIRGGVKVIRPVMLLVLGLLLLKVVASTFGLF